MIGSLTQDGMDKIIATESSYRWDGQHDATFHRLPRRFGRTSDQRSSHFSIRRTEADLITDMHEDLVISERDESQFAEVTMRRKIYRIRISICIQARSL